MTCYAHAMSKAQHTVWWHHLGHFACHRRALLLLCPNFSSPGSHSIMQSHCATALMLTNLALATTATAGFCDAGAADVGVAASPGAEVGVESSSPQSSSGNLLDWKQPQCSENSSRANEFIRTFMGAGSLADPRRAVGDVMLLTEPFESVRAPREFCEAERPIEVPPSSFEKKSSTPAVVCSCYARKCHQSCRRQ